MVKVLAFSDVHCNEEKCKSLVELSDSADLVIGAGDFGNARKGLERTFSILAKIQKPFVCVPGNAESYDELYTACKDFSNIHVLHGSGLSLLDLPIFGIGGGIPITPFGAWSYDFTEEEAEQLLRDCPSHGVLISHSPPNGAVDRTSAGKSIGSKAVLSTLIAKEPKLCICGHVHDCAGQSEMIGNTTVINAGPNGILLDLEVV